nr:hypothetical protein CFP56_46697 [Quercus suber]
MSCQASRVVFPSSCDRSMAPTHTHTTTASSWRLLECPRPRYALLSATRSRVVSHPSAGSMSGSRVDRAARACLWHLYTNHAVGDMRNGRPGNLSPRTSNAWWVTSEHAAEVSRYSVVMSFFTAKGQSKVASSRDCLSCIRAVDTS